MNRRWVIGGVVAVAVLGAAGWWILGRQPESSLLGGYIEGDPLYLAAPTAGAVVDIYAREGARITAGAPTFLIDPSIVAAQADGAQAALRAAEARAQDLRQGQRA